MKRFISSASKGDLPHRVDNVDRWMRIWRNSIFGYRTSSAVVIGLVGVMEVTNSRSKNIAAFSPLVPALQSLLHHWVHAGVVDGHAGTIDQYILIEVAVAADYPGEPRGRVANLQGSEHHMIVVFIRAGTR